MFRVQAARRAMVIILTAAWAAAILSGCKAAETVLKSPTPWVFSSVTPPATDTPAPSASATPAETPFTEPAEPVGLGTPLEQPGSIISIENVSGLRLWVDAGQGRPLSMIFSPNGDRLGIATTNGVYVYDPASLVREAAMHTGQQQTSLAFSSDGSLIASGDWHGRVRVWNADGEIRMDFDTGRLPVMSTAFSPEGDYLAAAGWDGRIRVWGTSDGVLKQEIKVRNHAVRAVSFSPDGKLLYGWAPGESIQAWRVEDGKTQEDIYLGKDPYGNLPSKAVFGQQGGEAAVYYTHSIKVYTTRNGYTRLALGDRADKIQRLALSEDGNTLAVLTVGNGMALEAEIYDLESSRQINRISFKAREVSQIALSADGKTLITAGSTLQIRDLSENFGLDAQAQRTGREEFQNGPVIDKPAAGNGLIFMAGGDGSLVSYDYIRGVSVSIMGGMENSDGFSYSRAAILPGWWGAFGDTDGNLILADLQMAGVMTSLQKHKRAIGSLVFTDDGSRLASGSTDGQVRVYDLAAGNTLLDLNVGEAVWDLAFFEADRAGGGYLILQTVSGIQIRSLQDGALVKQLAAVKMTVSADGSLLACVSRDGFSAMVNIYRLPGGEGVQSIPLEGYRLALSPDGSLLAMAGSDLTIWNSADGRLLLRLPGISCCGSLQFTAEGTALVQLLADGSIEVWGVP